MKIKLLRLLPFVLIVLCQGTKAQTQMPYWSLPPHKIDFTGSTPTATSLPTFTAPTGIIFDGLYYYITDELNHSIYKVNSAGDLDFFVGRDGTPGYIMMGMQRIQNSINQRVLFHPVETYLLLMPEIIEFGK